MALFRNSVTSGNQTHDMAATTGRARALFPPHALRKVFYLVDSFNVGGTETQAVCGICGVFHSDPVQRVNRELLAAMNRRIVHRGPDDDGFDANAGLAMRRLSIVDIQTGHQPLSNEDGNIWIVFNGEIYSHRDLRKDLQARRHRYRTQSDTETIVHFSYKR